MTFTHRYTPCYYRHLLLIFQVVSGGVSSNHNLRSRLSEADKLFDFDLHIPSPELCTDNGVMIAWAAIERLKAMEEGLPQLQEGSRDWMGGVGVCWEQEEMEALETFHRLPLGRSLSDEITAMRLKSSVRADKMLTIIANIARYIMF